MVQNDEWQTQNRYMQIEGMAEMANPAIKAQSLQITPKAAWPVTTSGHHGNYTTLTDVIISDRRVPAPGIVEALDVVEHVGLGLVACPVRFACRSFGFQRREEALHRRIIPTLPDRFIEQVTPWSASAAGTARYKAEVIHRRGPWRSFEAVEFATLEWVDWFNNRRLLEPIGNIPPAEAEERYYARLEDPAMAEWLRQNGLRKNWGGSIKSKRRDCTSPELTTRAERRSSTLPTLRIVAAVFS
jgi:hypothetical protein